MHSKLLTAFKQMNVLLNDHQKWSSSAVGKASSDIVFYSANHRISNNEERFLFSSLNVFDTGMNIDSRETAQHLLLSRDSVNQRKLN